MANAIRIPDFDTWRPGYANASVEVRLYGTTTLATLYADPEKTTTLSNPVRLNGFTDETGQSYGRWTQPVYVDEAIQLHINATATTGRQGRVLETLADEDASDALVTTASGSEARSLADALDRFIDVLAFGDLDEDAGAAANTTVLNAAIGIAAGRGGAEVHLPPGHYAHNPISLPEGVVLVGSARDATELMCQDAEGVWVISGERAGFRHIKLSGLTATAGSIGVSAIGVDTIIIDDVKIASFETGLRLKGGQHCNWRDFSISACSTGADLRGDVDSGNGSTGSMLGGIIWQGGTVSDNVSFGVIVRCVDRLVENIRLEGVHFDTNAGPAFKNAGGREVRLVNCSFDGNIAALAIEDGADLSQTAINTVRHFTMEGGYISQGSAAFNGTCQDVVFRDVYFEGVAISLAVPTNPILLTDCRTDATTTISGSQTKIFRQRTVDLGVQVAGVTTDASATTAWQLDLEPGQTVLIEAKAVARRRDGTETGVFWIAAAVTRGGAVLNYSGRTGAYTKGLIVRGQTSNATARIVDKSESGTDGTLTLRDIVGTFLNGEIIADTSTGSATISGSISSPTAALDDVGIEEIRPKGPTTTAYVLAIDASAGAARVRVTGASSNTVEWAVEVTLTTPT